MIEALVAEHAATLQPVEPSEEEEAAAAEAEAEEEEGGRGARDKAQERRHAQVTSGPASALAPRSRSRPASAVRIHKSSSGR
eukprot:2844919-Rhodomonas_salina.2